MWRFSQYHYNFFIHISPFLYEITRILSEASTILAISGVPPLLAPSMKSFIPRTSIQSVQRRTSAPFAISSLKGSSILVTLGTFFCPVCQEKKQYELRRVRRYLTFLFIPFIPLRKVGEYVECQECLSALSKHFLSKDSPTIKQPIKQHQSDL